MDLVAPSLHLPPVTDLLGSDYPFSVPVDKVVSPADLMKIQRDHYEGTAFDLTKGIAAGNYFNNHYYHAVNNIFLC
jgi:dipeptidase